MESHKNPNLETTHNHNHQLRRRRRRSPSLLAAEEGGNNVEGSTTPPPPPQEQEALMVVEEESGREKLKRHRVEMSGRVWIPDIWGQEDLLKKWIDCTVFDSCVEKNSVLSAREALIQEGRSTLTIENSC